MATGDVEKGEGKVNQGTYMIVPCVTPSYTLGKNSRVG